MTGIIEAWKGERVYLEDDVTASDGRLVTRKYKKLPIKTAIPSFQEAEVKEYFDVLKPVSNGAETADVTVLEIPRDIAATEVSLSSKNPNTSISLTILNKTLPQTSVFPMYSEVSSERSMYPKILVRGENIEDRNSKDKIIRDKWWDKYESFQGPQTLKAINLARQFGIEPTKQAISFFNLTDYGKYRYDKLVIENAIAPPLIWCGNLLDKQSIKPDQRVEWLRKINDIVPDDSLAYCADETGTIGMSVENAMEIIKLVRENAPKLRPMVTCSPRLFYRDYDGIFDAETIRSLEIVFAPVQNIDNLPIDLYPKKENSRFRKGSYFSCMAQGNCFNKVNSDCVDKRTEFPVAVVEGDPVNDFQRSIRLAYENQADFVLYYMLNKRTHKCWDKKSIQDTGIGIYSEGGNGDGTAMYYNPTEGPDEDGEPWPSVRMMHWDIARQQIEKEILDKQI